MSFSVSWGLSHIGDLVDNLAHLLVEVLVQVLVVITRLDARLRMRHSLDEIVVHHDDGRKDSINVGLLCAVVQRRCYSLSEKLAGDVVDCSF